MGILSRHKKEKLRIETFYKSIGEIYCPYFDDGKGKIIFNSDGFNHLQFSGGSEREKQNQLLKFRLLSVVPDIIRKSGTVQEYRKMMGKVGRKKADGYQNMKEIQYWGLIAIVFFKEENKKIKVILRKVGDGNVIFWSVMYDSRNRSKDTYYLASGDISED